MRFLILATLLISSRLGEPASDTKLSFSSIRLEFVISYFSTHSEQLAKSYENSKVLAESMKAILDEIILQIDDTRKSPVQSLLSKVEQSMKEWVGSNLVKLLVGNNAQNLETTKKEQEKQITKLKEYIENSVWASFGYDANIFENKLELIKRYLVENVSPTKGEMLGLTFKKFTTTSVYIRQFMFQPDTSKAMVLRNLQNAINMGEAILKILYTIVVKVHIKDPGLPAIISIYNVINEKKAGWIRDFSRLGLLQHDGSDQDIRDSYYPPTLAFYDMGKLFENEKAWAYYNINITGFKEYIKQFDEYALTWWEQYKDKNPINCLSVALIKNKPVFDSSGKVINSFQEYVSIHCENLLHVVENMRGVLRQMADNADCEEIKSISDASDTVRRIGFALGHVLSRNQRWENTRFKTIKSKIQTAFSNLYGFLNNDVWTRYGMDTSAWKIILDKIEHQINGFAHLAAGNYWSITKWSPKLADIQPVTRNCEWNYEGPFIN